MASRWVDVGRGRQRLVTDEDLARAVREQESLFGVRAEHLSPKLRRSLRIQLGRDFRSRSELERYMRQNDFRVVEPGEKQDVLRKDLREWIRDTKPGSRGENPNKSRRRYSPIPL